MGKYWMVRMNLGYQRKTRRKRKRIKRHDDNEIAFDEIDFNMINSFDDAVKSKKKR